MIRRNSLFTSPLCPNPLLTCQILVDGLPSYVHFLVERPSSQLNCIFHKNIYLLSAYTSVCSIWNISPVNRNGSRLNRDAFHLPDRGAQKLTITSGIHNNLTFLLILEALFSTGTRDQGNGQETAPTNIFGHKPNKA